MHVSAIEENKELTFIHKVKEGSVDKSYGIHVASLAKLPKKIISRANDVLEVYETKEKVRSVKVQEHLVFEEKDDLKEELKKLNVLQMTPLEAIDVLYKLHNKAKE
ncbi:MAG: hypothetical protein LRY26_00815 [Bacilli bacterium]|nr:hypothetical protein [Bacilli bacterium]